jgi:hypothetical protein
MNQPTQPGTSNATKMTTAAASRIQSATAQSHGGKVARGSFAARAMSSAAKGGGKK